MTTQSALRDLRQISLSDLVDSFKPPEQKIHYEEDVAHWKQTTGYHDYQLFLRRLNESVVGHTAPRTSDSDADSGGCSQVSSLHRDPFGPHCTCLLGHNRPPYPSGHARQVDRRVTTLESWNSHAALREPNLQRLLGRPPHQGKYRPIHYAPRTYTPRAAHPHIAGIRQPPKHVTRPDPHPRHPFPQALFYRIVW